MPVILHSFTSVAHLVASSVALVAGTLVLWAPKGTPFHRLVGRAYVASMVALLLTAFRMYYLFGRFGIVHWGAVGSTIALAVGMGAVWSRPLVREWRRWHYFGMGASITGLYAAFLVESTYRLFPTSYFWWSALGLSAAVFLTGGLLLYRGSTTARWALSHPNPRAALPTQEVIGAEYSFYRAEMSKK